MEDSPAPRQPGSPESGAWAELLRAVQPAACLPAPARSADDLAEQAQRVHGLAAGEVPAGSGTGTLDDDLLLARDLAVCETLHAHGELAPLTGSVRLAARAAWSAAEQARAAAPARSASPTRTDAVPPERVGGARRLTAPPAVARRSPAWSAGRPMAALLIAGLLLAVGVRVLRTGDAPPEHPQPDEARTRMAQVADELGRALAPAGRAAPFVEARLWRSVEGRALRGGAGLELTQRRVSEPPAAVDAPVAPDVVLGWKPDALGMAASRLRVHVRGPAGLVVALPDLGVEATLTLPATSAEPAPLASAVPPASPSSPASPSTPGPSQGVPDGYVDLALPAGWAERLVRGELRLAFSLPPAAPHADATQAGASQGGGPSRARFDGVSLPRASGPEGS